MYYIENKKYCQLYLTGFDKIFSYFLKIIFLGEEGGFKTKKVRKAQSFPHLL